METETTGRRVWAVVLHDRQCLPGVLVLDYALQKQGTKYPLIVIMTHEAATDADITEVLGAADITVELVDTIFAEERGKKYTGNWQKLSAWSLTNYERIILLDSNHLILQPIDDLHQAYTFSGNNDCIAAVPVTPGYPHTSTIILHPSLDQYAHLQNKLNEYFFPAIDVQGVLIVSYPNRLASLSYVCNALESKRNSDIYRLAWEGSEVKVRLYDLGRPWEEGRRDGGGWLEVWRDIRRKWVGDGVWGFYLESRRLWEKVLEPMVGDEL